MKAAALLSFSLLCFSCSQQTDKIDLAGSWTFSTDSMDWSRVIELPGSMASNGLGEDIAVGTDWTGGIVDSSYFLNLRMPNTVRLEILRYLSGFSR